MPSCSAQVRAELTLARRCAKVRAMPTPLRPHPKMSSPKGPVVLVVMDGIGRGAGDEADAVAIASTPTLDRLWVPGVRAELRAHGKAVGLPSDDDMGNSEVGHNALGGLQIHPWATGLDTACVYGGRLSAMVLREGERIPSSMSRRRALIVQQAAARAYFDPPKRFRIRAA